MHPISVFHFLTQKNHTLFNRHFIFRHLFGLVLLVFGYGLTG